MINYRNNNRDNKYRNNNRGFRSGRPNNTDISSKNGLQRRHPNANGHNAPKLIEKYNDLAREASSTGDKILSENFYQHADHFLRISLEHKASRIEPKKENTNLPKTELNGNGLSKKEVTQEKLNKDI